MAEQRPVQEETMMDEQDLRAFNCLNCGMKLGVVHVWQEKQTAINLVLESVGKHCPRCGRTLNTFSTDRLDLYFAWRVLRWNVLHLFRTRKLSAV